MPPLLTEEQIESGQARIVEVAERQAVARGIDRVSMHSIARELGWTATALYRYFENKDAILAAARCSAYNRLSDLLEESIQTPGDVWTRSRAVGNAYVKFAFKNPNAYKLMFALSQPDPTKYPDLMKAMTRARRNATRYIEIMVEENEIDADPELLGHVFWAGTHGMISLQMAGQLGEDTPAFEEMRHEMMRRLIQSAVSIKSDKKKSTKRRQSSKRPAKARVKSAAT